MQFAPRQDVVAELAQNFLLYRRMAYYENGGPVLMGQDRAISNWHSTWPRNNRCLIRSRVLCRYSEMAQDARLMNMWRIAS
jgi:hypothetical protein